jgi:phosphopantetheine--protein transferase-like protein
MEEEIKNIVSQYIKIPAGQITAQTVIDRSAVASSIILHRMYAQLGNNGIHIKDYTTVKTFGQLLAGINGVASPGEIIELPVVSYMATSNVNELAVGIDMENISSMPLVNDFREDAFYTMNFTAAEIAYCILQNNPCASFAGLFAAKEAIVKADNLFKNKSFNTINIDHLPDGKPVFPGFQVSITHTNDYAAAIAIKNISLPVPPISVTNTHPGTSLLTIFLSTIALILSLFTIVLYFLKMN